MKKNGKIELLRFWFSICVLCLHIQKYFPGEASLKEGIRFHFFPYGGIGVEFFFVVSGFLMAASVFYASEAQKSLPLGEATFRFFKSKFTSLIPMRLLAFVLLLVATVRVESWGFMTVVEKLIAYIPGFFLVQMSGLGEVYINHVEWYLSMMFIGMFIIYPFLRKNFDVFSNIVAPAVAILVLGYMYRSFGRLSDVRSWEGMCYRSMFSGVAELCLGVTCFAACQRLAEWKPSVMGRLVFTLLELLCWGAVFTMIMLTLPRKYEFYMLTFITLGVICAFSMVSYGSKLFDNKFSYLLGKLSLPIYLCQLIPITVIPEYYGHLPMKQQMTMAVVSTILLALAVSGLSKLMAIGKRSRNIENQSK